MAKSKSTAGPKTMIRVDQYGNEVEVQVGIDGKNPISPNNPPAKAQSYISEDAYAFTEGNVEDAPVESSDDSDGEDKAPAKSASKGDWVDYAVSQDADREEAEAATKEELIEKYGN